MNPEESVATLLRIRFFPLFIMDMISILQLLNEIGCWDGKKLGTPKTKISSKTGKRVNNCVPIEELVTNTKVICDNCGWKWDIADGGDDLYTCHNILPSGRMCNHDNTPK